MQGSRWAGPQMGNGVSGDQVGPGEHIGGAQLTAVGLQASLCYSATPMAARPSSEAQARQGLPAHQYSNLMHKARPGDNSMAGLWLSAECLSQTSTQKRQPEHRATGGESSQAVLCRGVGRQQQVGATPAQAPP